MIEYRKVDKFPDEVLAHPNIFAKTSKQIIAPSSVLAFSKENRYILEDGKPLLFCGAFKSTAFSPHAEIWMYATEYLKARHVKELQKEFRKWLTQQNVRIVARCEGGKAARFLRFMGFRKVEVKDNIELYEAAL